MATPRRLRMSALLQTRDGTPSNKDARLTNCILEKNGDELNFLKRPGFTLSTTPATGIGAGATVIKDSTGAQQIISVVDTTIYTTQSAAGATWPATTGSTDMGSGAVEPIGILYFNSKFWILGLRATNGTLFPSIYSSTDTITWTLATATPAYNTGSGRTLFGACVFGGKMWVMGGNNGSALHDVWSSSDGITWLQATAAAAWAARIQPMTLVFNNKMWVLGDTNGGNNDVYYTSDGITWTQATASAAWSTRIRFAAFVIAGKMFVAGGYLGGSNWDNTLYSSSDGVTWSNVGTAAWSARERMQSFVLNNRAYIATGMPGATYLKDMWSSADGITWTQVTADIGIVGASGGACDTFQVKGTFLAARGTVYVFGQVINGTWSSTIYTATTATTTTSTGTVTAGTAPSPSAPTSSVTQPGAIIDWSANLDGTQIALKNTSAAWKYTVSGQTLTQITDANYPPVTVRGLVYLDGTFYVMDPYGQIWGSNTINDFTTWAALNEINAQAEPDAGVCLTKYDQYVVALGQYTTEYFFDAGNATGSPLSVVQNATQMVGCACGDSVVQAESNVYFIAQAKAHGQTFNPSRFVAKLDGMSYSTISTPSIDRILNSDTLVGAWGVYCKMLGHAFYIISMPVSAISIGLDLKTGIWYYFSTGTLQTAQSITAANLTYTLQTDGKALVSCTLNSHGFADGDRIIIAGATQTAYNGTFNIRYASANVFTYVAATVPAATPSTGSPTAQGCTQGVFPLLQAFNYNGNQLFQHYSNGAIYQISDTTYTDNSVFIDTKGRFERFDDGLSQDGNSQNKFAAWIDAVTDRTSSNLLIRWTDDDYQTYVHYRSVDLSLNRSRLHRCGTFIRRAFDIRHTDTVALRFQGIDVGLEQGTE